MSTDLPPEAFTRETLQEAFNWLQNQPEAIRTQVQTPERLVSLYQKSLRLNDTDAPVSSKKFITDLKNLASSLDQFTPPANLSTSEPDPKPLAPKLAEPPVVAPPTDPVPATSPTKIKADPPALKAVIPWDEVTQKRLTQVRERFNLSDDSEALRLLISLGFEKFSEF